MMLKTLCNSISSLTLAVRELGDLEKSRWEWCKSHYDLATKQDLRDMENRLMMTIAQAIEVLNTLSTATDTLSIKVDHVVEDVTRLIAGLGKLDLSPEQEALVEKAKASITAAATAGDKADAAVLAADNALPHPAPAGA